MYTELAALLVLAVLSLHDIRARELPPRMVHASLALVAVLRVAEYMLHPPAPPAPLWLYAAVDAIMLAATAAVAALGLLGWGDVAALLIVAVASPLPSASSRIMPPLLPTLLYYVAMGAGAALANFALNLIQSREELRKLPPRYRIAYALLARPVEARKLMERPGWWYPLNLCGRYSLRFNIYMNPEDVAKELKKALGKGCIKYRDRLWASYAFPGVPMITTAYALALVLGDKPLLAIACTSL